jgi:hypothetical protein
VLPDSKRICGFLTSRLLPAYDPKGLLEFRPDTSEVRALQEDEVQRSQYVDRYWRTGVTLNSLISTYRLPFGPQPGGDEAHPGGVVASPVPAFAAPVAGKAAPSKATTNAARAKHRQALALLGSLSPKMASAVTSFMEDQAGRMERAVRAGTEYRAKDEDNARLAAAMAPHLTKAVGSGRLLEVEFIAKLTKAAVRVDSKASARVQRWVEINALRWAKIINQNTYEKVEREIDAAVQAGGSRDDVAKAVAEALGEERDFRSVRVAQTEMLASLNEGALEAYRDNSDVVAGKAWMATNDDATRDTHSAAGERYAAVPIPVDADFEVGSGRGPAPGQLGVPEEDINCRCTIYPVIKK